MLCDVLVVVRVASHCHSSVQFHNLIHADQELLISLVSQVILEHGQIGSQVHYLYVIEDLKRLKIPSVFRVVVMEFNGEQELTALLFPVVSLEAIG